MDFVLRRREKVFGIPADASVGASGSWWWLQGGCITLWLVAWIARHPLWADIENWFGAVVVWQVEGG